MATYFTADLHFNHQGIITHCKRGFDSVTQMNESLVERWNETVKRESDAVWVLGDFGFKHPQGEDLGVLFHRLRGRKSLVVGNHDERNPLVLRLPWERVERLVTFRDNGRRAELCHYPLETWKSAATGALMLHGHSHGTLRRTLPRRFDVGIDVFTGGPVEFDALIEMASLQTFAPTDHHGSTSSAGVEVSEIEVPGLRNDEVGDGGEVC